MNDFNGLVRGTGIPLPWTYYSIERNSGRKREADKALRVKKKAVMPGYGNDRSSAKEWPFLCCPFDRCVEFRKRRVKLRRVFAAGLREVGLAAARAAQDRSHLLDEVARVEPGHEVL